MSAGHDPETGGAAGDVVEDDALGARPEADKLARAVRRSRIENKLFATEELVKLGRYQLLEVVGSGGIGVVWGAWDPELERRVAIKLIKPTIQAARDRILLEGQALAKLSHPNVVPVYDVGVFDEQVYLVMEWVRGETLRAYCAEPRKLREILAVYRAAGEGLHAAHRAGLIHRDFKPDNAIRGDDERVRVLDFGLARGEVSPEAADPKLTRGAGTPRYMPPEQSAGTTLTPAADQYSFCVSLREAIVARDGRDTRAVVPKWIDTILTKGTAREPARRHPSMGELLRSLARDPATVWRRRLLAGAAVLVAAIAFVVGSLRASSNEIEPCSGGDAEIATAWNVGANLKMTAHLRSLGPYALEESSTLVNEMAKFAKQWAATHRTTCKAAERREMTPQLYERNLACLARARVNYATVVEVLSTAGPERLSSAIVAARGLPAVDRCAFEALSSTVTPPPPAIAQAASELAGVIERGRVLALTDAPTAVDVTQAAALRADALGYEPLVARAQLAYGLALIGQEKAIEAIPVLERGAVAAVDAFDDITFVEAYAREVYALSVTPKREDGTASPLGAVAYVERVAKRAGDSGGFVRALLFNNLGTSRLASGDVAGAAQWFDRSLAETASRDRNAELLHAFGNRALVTDDPVERNKLLTQGREAFERLLGANHRKTLDARIQAAFFIEHPHRAAAELRELCALYVRYHATVAPDTIDHCASELGWLAEERGDLVEARAAMAQVRHTDGPLREIAVAYLLMLDGKHDAAAAAAERIGESYKTQKWARSKAADAFLFAAVCHLQGGRRDAALANARASLALLNELSFRAQMPHYQRRLARTRAVLARLVAKPEAKQLATDAARWYRTAGGYDAIAQELEAITRDSR